MKWALSPGSNVKVGVLQDNKFEALVRVPPGSIKQNRSSPGYPSLVRAPRRRGERAAQADQL
jgi:hypothetical protein